MRSMPSLDFRLQQRDPRIRVAGSSIFWPGPERLDTGTRPRLLYPGVEQLDGGTVHANHTQRRHSGGTQRPQHGENCMASSRKLKQAGSRKATRSSRAPRTSNSGLFRKQILNTLSEEKILSLATSPGLAKLLSEFVLQTKSRQREFLSFALRRYASSGSSASASGQRSSGPTPCTVSSTPGTVFTRMPNGRS